MQSKSVPEPSALEARTGMPRFLNPDTMFDPQQLLCFILNHHFDKHGCVLSAAL
jgi:hypothetical protein